MIAEKTRVYIAAPWAEKDGLAKEAKLLFEAAGFLVTSSWISREVPPPQTDKENGYDPVLLRAEAYDDEDDLLYSDVVVIINSQKRGEETSGKAVETGMAIAYTIPIVLVGNRTNVFHYMDEVHVVDTIEEAIEEAKRVA